MSRYVSKCSVPEDAKDKTGLLTKECDVWFCLLGESLSVSYHMYSVQHSQQVCKKDVDSEIVVVLHFGGPAT